MNAFNEKRGGRQPAHIKGEYALFFA